MTLSFDQLTVNGRAYPMRGTVTQAIEGEGIKGETARVATRRGCRRDYRRYPWRLQRRARGNSDRGRWHLLPRPKARRSICRRDPCCARVDQPVQINTAK